MEISIDMPAGVISTIWRASLPLIWKARSSQERYQQDMTMSEIYERLTEHQNREEVKIEMDT
eukprot:6211307-Pleurochrysis_carterae.AAC.4